MARKPPKVRHTRAKQAARARSTRLEPAETPIAAEVVAIEPSVEDADEVIPAEAHLIVDDADAELTAAAETSRIPQIDGLEDESATAPAESSGSLVPVDPLGRYLAEIRRFRILSREEEIEIAKRYARYRDPA